MSELSLKKPSSDKLVGATVQDRYKVLRLLGAGGMGEVYEVEHVRIGRKLALKRLHGHFAEDDTILERFHREARAATMIGNKHIVEVTDMGELPDGSPYIILEYLEGEDLASLLLREGALSIARCVHIMSQVCDGLSAAHGKGIIHRDLKPENIFILDGAEHRDFIKILDFGISKVREQAEKVESLTSTGQALGTPFYMSVEQANGQRDVDGRADVYALGVILYRMLTGRLPFHSETYMSLMVEILTEEPPPMTTWRRDLPTALEDAVLTALSKDRERRYQTVEELSEALSAFADLDGEPQMTEPRAGDAEAATAADLPSQRTQAYAEGSMSLATMPEVPEKEASISTDPEASALTDPVPQGADEAPGRALATEEPSREGEPATAPSPRRSGLIPLILGAALFFVGLGAIFAARPDIFGLAPPMVTQVAPDQGAELPAAPPDPSPAEAGREAPSAPPEAPSQEVRVQIKATPAAARIFIDDVEYPNPTDASQPRSLTPVRVKVLAQGYRSVEQLAIFDRDRALEYGLSRGGGTERLELVKAASRSAPARVERSGSGEPPPTPAKASKAPASEAPPEIYQGPRGTLRDSFD